MKTSGTLYIVATPIGNLEDITLRAIRTLNEVDLIAAEDTRHSKKLLNHLEITTSLISYYRENEAQRSSELIDMLFDGKDIALISDAGTPGISDPGAVLVQKALQAEITVAPIPGPAAVATAISCAGLTEGSFMFLGFAPSKQGQRQKLLTEFKDFTSPIVFYESPHRIHKFLDDSLTILGDRKIFWARELTKNFEELRLTDVSTMADEIKDKRVKGELVIIVFPQVAIKADENAIIETIERYCQNDKLTVKDISKLVAKELNTSRSKVYQLILQHKKNN